MDQTRTDEVLLVDIHSSLPQRAQVALGEVTLLTQNGLVELESGELLRFGEHILTELLRRWLIAA